MRVSKRMIIRFTCNTEASFAASELAEIQRRAALRRLARCSRGRCPGALSTVGLAKTATRLCGRHRLPRDARRRAGLPKDAGCRIGTIQKPALLSREDHLETVAGAGSSTNEWGSAPGLLAEVFIMMRRNARRTHTRTEALYGRNQR